MTERTLALIKSGAVARRQTGNIIHIIETHGLAIVRLQKFTPLSVDRARRFYVDHFDKPYFADLIASVTGPEGALALELQAPGAIAHWRRMMGATNPAMAAPGTIRHDFSGTTIADNAVHGSDSAESFEREFKIMFESPFA